MQLLENLLSRSLHQLVSVLLASFQPAPVIPGRGYQVISGFIKPRHLRKHSTFSFTTFLLGSGTLLFTPRRSLGISGELQGRCELLHERTDPSIKAYLYGTGCPPFTLYP